MRLSFRQTFGAVLALGMLLATGAAVAAGGGDDLVACREQGQTKVLPKRWTRITAPPMNSDEGPRTVTAFTAAPRRPNRLFATNGTVVKRSDDGGCTWELMQRSSPVGEVPNGEYQADVFLDLTSPTDTQLWATSHDTAGGVSRPHVHIFQKLDDSGTGEHGMVENGLPPAGKPVGLTSAAGFGDTAVYVMIEEPPDATTGSLDPVNRIYTTVVPSEPPELARIGTVWQQVKPPTGFGKIEGMATGPGRSLWIWSGSKIAMTTASDVAETTWQDETLAEGDVLGIDVDTSGTALVAVETSQKSPTGVVFDNKLKRVRSQVVPVAPVSMAHGTRLTRGVSGDAGTWGFDAFAKRWINVTPKGVGALRGLRFANGRSGKIMLGHAKGYLFRFDLYEGESFVPGAPGLSDDGGDVKLPYSKIKSPTITPSRKVITVEPGKVVDQDVTFGMPPAINPLDVYFLVDTTSSMQPAIDSLRANLETIAFGLRKEVGRDACFGVGEFKDFGANTTALDSDKVFRTHLKVNTCDDHPNEPGRHLKDVQAALAKLKQAGGGDDPEAHTVALEQMLTDEPRVNPPVLAGQGAGFRPGSYKVAVLVSDVEFKQGGGYPTIDGVGKTLKTNAIKVVSALVQTFGEDRLARAREDMEQLAEATDSRAPKGGVDCDGDKKESPDDVHPGGPLVCFAGGGESINIGPVIISLLLGVQDPGTIAVDVDDPHSLVKGRIRGQLSRIVNLKREAQLGFTLPLGCTQAQDGQDLPLGLTPTVRAVPLEVRGEIVVRCRSIPLVPPPPNVPEPPVVPEPEPVVPAPPRLQIALALPPPLNPPAQPISNMNLNAGFSQQEEQQFQLAAVTQGAGEEAQEQEDVELAMMGLEQDTSATPVAAFLTGAMVISAAAGVAYRRRLQRATATAYARVR